ncbi:MAG: tRNA (adenosine(37)-N6)-threonylcarbamoyltransferase complex ATPase subunit type 1 TsaE [Cyclonatronaceae bacterium]
MEQSLKRFARILSTSIEDTLRAGEGLGAMLSPGDIVQLKGDLGAGKTHFVKGVARFFGVPEHEVQSPTFAIIHEHPGTTPLYHVDAYRLNRPEEALEFGIEEYLYGDGICLIEWPEKIASLLPETCWVVQISHADENRRQISIQQQR